MLSLDIPSIKSLICKNTLDSLCCIKYSKSSITYSNSYTAVSIKCNNDIDDDLYFNLNTGEVKKNLEQPKITAIINIIKEYVELNTIVELNDGNERNKDKYLINDTYTISRARLKSFLDALPRLGKVNKKRILKDYTSLLNNSDSSLGLKICQTICATLRYLQVDYNDPYDNDSFKAIVLLDPFDYINPNEMEKEDSDLEFFRRVYFKKINK